MAKKGSRRPGTLASISSLSTRREGPSTWMALTRDLSDVVRVEGESRIHATVILEMETGLVRGVGVASTDREALAQAFTKGLTEPAGDQPPRRPDTVLCRPTDAALVRRAMARIPGLDPRPPIQAAEPPAEAEDIFDSLIAHLGGRHQPLDPPTPKEWASFYRQALDYFRAAPWDRWHDGIVLNLEITRDGEPERYAAVVMGNAGVQHGLALYAGDGLPPELEGWEPGQPPRRLDRPRDSLARNVACLLEAPDELPADVRSKAARYGWPEGADLVPVAVQVDPDGMGAEPSGDDVQILAVALAAVTAHDRRGPLALSGQTGEDGTIGTLVLDDGSTARYSLSPRAPAARLDGPRYQVYQAGFDLVPDGTGVVIGHLPRAALSVLRGQARIHRPLPPDAPAPSGDEIPLVVILADETNGAALAAQVAQLDPYGVAMTSVEEHEVVVLVGGNGSELLVEVDGGSPSLAKYRRRLRATKGVHALMVADQASSQREGTVYGFFECHQPPQPAPSKSKPKKK